MELRFELHDAQREILESGARFKVVAAGRRFGKTYLASIWCILQILKELPEHVEVWYVSPTFVLGKQNIWPYVMSLGQGVWQHTVAHDGAARAINGRWFRIKSADRPDLLRGSALGAVVMDEYGTMNPEAWEYAIRPALMDVKGEALFIGTPTGRNHFYRTYLEGTSSPGWRSWQHSSTANPFLSADELKAAKGNMSHLAYKREVEASFAEGSGTEFKEHQIVFRDDPKDGDIYMAVDPAGYQDAATYKGSKYASLDETAIAIVRVGSYGWHVCDIEHGRWGIRETSIRILNAARRWKPVKVGIERGALTHALRPYLEDQMRRLGVYPSIAEVSHNNQKKTDRIVWALQGRMEQGRITFSEGEYMDTLKEQLLDFPSDKTHDDLLDALAYIDQVAITDYRGDDWQQDPWKPLDWAVGI